MTDLLTQIINFHPFNEQEQLDQQLILSVLKTNPLIFKRESHLAHITVSSWLVSPDFTQVLMAYHKIYQSFAWLGGHADGNNNLQAVIKKEVQEESGLKNFSFLSEQPFSIEVLPVAGHQKNGHYVSSHLHLNITYLMQASTNQPLRIKPDENSQIAWLDIATLKTKISEPWFYEHIYQKLIAKMQAFINN